MEPREGAGGGRPRSPLECPPPASAPLCTRDDAQPSDLARFPSASETEGCAATGLEAVETLPAGLEAPFEPSVAECPTPPLPSPNVPTPGCDGAKRGNRPDPPEWRRSRRLELRVRLADAEALAALAGQWGCTPAIAAWGLLAEGLARRLTPAAEIARLAKLLAQAAASARFPGSPRSGQSK